MRESDVRHKLREEWKEWADVCAIENEAGMGMPDLNVCHEGEDFWVEIKYKENAPKRESTPYLKGCLRASQILWITNRLNKGAKNIFLFARVEDELFLYHIKSLSSLSALEELCGEEIYINSIWYGVMRKKPDWRGALSAMWGAVK